MIPSIYEHYIIIRKGILERIYTYNSLTSATFVSFGNSNLA